MMKLDHEEVAFAHRVYFARHFMLLFLIPNLMMILGKLLNANEFGKSRQQSYDSETPDGITEQASDKHFSPFLILYACRLFPMGTAVPGTMVGCECCQRVKSSS